MVQKNDIFHISDFVDTHDWSKQIILTYNDELKYYLLHNIDTFTALEYLFNTSLKLFKACPSTIDLIHRNILDYIHNYDDKMKFCVNILQHFSEITLDVHNEIDGLNLIQYYHKIINEIISVKKLTAYNYDCLTEIARFNPLIIEEKLPEILRKILPAKKVTNKEQESYVGLLLEILNACHRLRRETKLIPLVLMALDGNSNKKINNCNINDVLPNLFLETFSNAVSAMTIPQITKLMMSFTYHLDVISGLDTEKSTLVTSIEAVAKLLIAFFEGVYLFDSTTTIMQQKFVNSLDKIGNVIDKLIKFINIYNDDILLLSILKIIYSWESLVALIKKYAPDSLNEESMSSILQTIKNIHAVIDSRNYSNCTNGNLIRFMVCCKFEEKKIYQSPLITDNDDEILNKIDKYWDILLEKYPCLISHLNTSQFEQLANILVNNTHFGDDILISTPITHSVIQQNEKMIIKLISIIFYSISTNLSNITKKILKIILKKPWDDKRINKILENCRELFSNKPEWLQVDDEESIFLIIKNLQILLVLPLTYMTVEVRTIIFLVTFAIGKECEKSKKIRDLCSCIMSDISENGNIDILQYIHPESLISELSKYPSIIKFLQCSLRNASNYQLVETFIKNNKSIDSCAAPILIQCIGKIKPRLKVNEKRIARKIEKKLSKRILRSLNNGVKTSYEIKCLTAAVKVAIASKKVDDYLFDKINSTLDSIFGINKVSKTSDDSVVQEGLELIKIILLHQSHIPIDKKISQCIWTLMLKNPSEDIMKNLFSVTSSELLKKVLIMLQKQIVSAQKLNNEQLFKNSLKVWCSIAHTTMGIRSNIIRHNHLQSLLRYLNTTTLPGHFIIILNICKLTIRAKKSQLPEKTIDLILLTVNNFINNPETLTTNVCEEILEICSVFLRYRIEVMTGRLPALLLIYRRVFKVIIEKSRKNPSPNNRELECLSINAQKLVMAFVKLKRDIARITAYTVADLIEIYSQGVISAYMKEPLNCSVSMFLGICDQHVISLLLRALPVSMQEIFKSLYATYNKFYKFVGKI